jgi:acetyltransferase (GNAT) family protein
LDARAGATLEQAAHMTIRRIQPSGVSAIDAWAPVPSAVAGAAAKLCARVEQEALALRLSRIFAETSITARPFFESIGFRVVTEQTVELRQVSFRNFRMEKELECGN